MQRMPDLDRRQRWMIATFKVVGIAWLALKVAGGLLVVAIVADAVFGLRLFESVPPLR